MVTEDKKNSRIVCIKVEVGPGGLTYKSLYHVGERLVVSNMKRT